MDVTSYLLGKQAGGGGGSANLQSNKNVSITTNGTQVVNPDSGYDGLKKATITTNVTPTLQDKDVSILSNGSTTVTSDQGYDGLDKVNITTNVTPDLESKSVTITSNTTTTITPTSGKDGLSSVEVITSVSDGYEEIYEISPDGITNLDYSGLTGILDINWQAKIVCQSTTKTDVNFYKIVNNKIDLTTITTHTLTSLGLLNNPYVFEMKFADLMLNDNEIVIGYQSVQGNNNNKRFMTAILNVNDFSISNISVITPTTSGVFNFRENLEKVPNSTDEFVYCYTHQDGAGNLTGITVGAFYHNSSHTTVDNRTYYTFTSSNISSSYARLCGITNNALTTSVIIDWGTQVLTLNATRQDPHTQFSVLNLVGKGTSTTQFITSNLLVSGTNVYDKSDLTTSIATFPYSIVATSQTFPISQTNYCLVKVSNVIYGVDVSDNSFAPLSLSINNSINADEKTTVFTSPKAGFALNTTESGLYSSINFEPTSTVVEVRKNGRRYFYTGDATAVSSDITLNKIAYNSNGKVVGTKPSS